jgi:hypothetical protein
MKRLDLSGQKFGRLTVLTFFETRNGKSKWLCRCDCGKEKVVSATDLKSGNTKSCGCLNLERAIENIKGRKRKAIPMIGKRFGKLVVLSEAKSNRREKRYLCQCDCGNKHAVLGTLLRNGKVRSCGCFQKETARRHCLSMAGRPSPRAVDLIGQKFEALTVLEKAEKTNTGQQKWKCVCECGNIVFPTTAHLRSGHTISCGCLGLKHATEAKIKHGKSSTPLYLVHRAMIDRCENPNTKGFKWYGKKGVKVCDEWKDFQTFYDWAMKHGYQEGLTIDRINPDGNYCPENCEWVTRSENSRRSHLTRK